MPSLPQPVRKKLMAALPRPASRKSLDAGEKSEKKEDSVKNARRNSLRAADTLSDLLGAIGRPSFFRQKSGKEKSRKKKTAMTGIGLDGCLRTEDGIEYLRKFCRQFPGQRKYLEFWLLVGGTCKLDPLQTDCFSPSRKIPRAKQLSTVPGVQISHHLP